LACGTKPAGAPQIATATTEVPSPPMTAGRSADESVTVVPGDNPPPPKVPNESDQHEQERATAKEAAEDALAKAGLRQLALDTTITPRREVSSERTLWRFAVFTEKGEQAGWLLVTTQGVVTIEALDHELSLVDYKRLRAQQSVMSKRLAQLPIIRSYCQWVATQTGIKGCLYWIEAAPALDCKPTAKQRCFWQAYVGADNGSAAARHFTLLIDAGSAALFVNELGAVLPLKKWRSSQPF
jgi:hypothetical protein